MHPCARVILLLARTHCCIHTFSLQKSRMNWLSLECHASYIEVRAQVVVCALVSSTSIASTKLEWDLNETAKVEYNGEYFRLRAKQQGYTVALFASTTSTTSTMTGESRSVKQGSPLVYWRKKRGAGMGIRSPYDWVWSSLDLRLCKRFIRSILGFLSSHQPFATTKP